MCPMLEASPVLEREATSTVLVMAVRAVETWTTILPTHTTSLKSSVILSVSNGSLFPPYNRMDSYLLGSGTGRRGGGRIWLESNKIEVIGSLKANGEDGNTYGAGGSGGTIVLRAPMIVIDRTSLSSLIRLFVENAAIWANGGMGNPVLLGKNSWKFGGGGGGRIFLRYSVLECGNLDVIVA